MTNEKILIETPVQKNPARVTKPSRVAAGFVAVWTALEHCFRTWSLFRPLRGLLKINQKNGFDCPGCAWPDPDDHRHVAEFCENGAKALAEETTPKRASPEVFGAWSIAQLSQLSDYNLGLLGRFTEPMLLDENSDRYQRISWERAFEMVSESLHAGRPNEAVFYTSGKATNEPAFLFQLFARMLGTNNLPDCSNMCHESSGYALNRTIGSGKGSVKLDDFDHADCILVIGQNPGTNHPRMLSALQKAARNGAQIITVNPLREAGLIAFNNPQEVSGMLGMSTPLSTLHLPVRINGDVAVLKGIMKLILEADALSSGSGVDHAFVAQHTNGFPDLKSDLENVSWAEIEHSSGLKRDAILEAAQIILKSERMISCWAMGITQHKNGVANVEQIVNLHLLRGQFGKKGAGVCPVRGHSNVQGDRTMGIWEQMGEEFLAKLSNEFSFDAPRAHGMDVVASIEAMKAGRVKTFISLGGNFQSATPDTAYVTDAIRNVDLFVHISTKPHRGHLIKGKRALILPCLGRSEIDEQKSGPQFTTTENSMGVIQPSEGNLKPASKHLRSEVGIVAGMAEATFRKVQGGVNWNALIANYDLIRNHIEHVVPGFENFNVRIRKEKTFHLPHAVRDQLEFKTKSGKGEFKVSSIPTELLTRNEEFILMTIRSHDQFNTTIYGENDRYRGIHHGRRVIFMNPQDMKEKGLAQGKTVNIQSHFEGQVREVKKFTIVPYDIPHRCVAGYYPETNPLGQIGNFAEESRQPVYKSLVVTLSPSA